MPSNPHVRARLEACLKQLQAAYDGGSGMSSSSKGTERELFVEIFLKNVLPPAYRFGTGEITDVHRSLTRQIDVVIEHSMVPSFPLVGAPIPRLYLAEGVAAAIEVKSDLTRQWKEVVAVAKSVAKLRPTNHAIPFFAVGYRGWASSETLLRYVDAANQEGSQISGVISLDPPLSIGSIVFQEPQPPQKQKAWPHVELPQPPKLVNKTVVSENASTLFSLLTLIHLSTTRMLLGASPLLDYMAFEPLATMPKGRRSARSRQGG